MMDEFGELIPPKREDERNMTDADVAALAVAVADVMESRVIDRFYKNLGRGLWALIKKGAFVALMFLAGYGIAVSNGGH